MSFAQSAYFLSLSQRELYAELMKKKPRIIVTIGGGSIGKPGPDNTLPIDKEIVKLSGKKHPQFLFIPTASSDDEHYGKAMEKQYYSGRA